ncbi:putative inactive receptor kinase [Camellia lanceoleosa]|uniref:Inactive receptor kinase n=1 Tax=Camellia lanceoleosa TaxID=1840588 RepID=A0ACC0FU80_9ERIC|nr:putative inactive receptor kinase [Camellia lanceoleosa]
MSSSTTTSSSSPTTPRLPHLLPIAAQRMVSYKSPNSKTTKDFPKIGRLVLRLPPPRATHRSRLRLPAPPGVNGVDLCGWVHRAVREEWTAEILDVEIAVQRSATHSMLRLLQIAIRCCEKAPEKRPDMAEVAREIENIKVVVDSEDSEDLSQSITDDSMSMSATPSIMNGH